MKWLAAVLLAANVVLYLWGSSSDAERRQGVLADNSSLEVNREGMLLVDEARLTRRNERQADSAPHTQLTDLQCYRIGPFLDQDGWDAAQAWMEEQEMKYHAAHVERKVRVKNVYLVPVAGDTAAEAVRWDSVLERLEEEGLEYFSEVEEARGQGGRIAMGYFTQDGLAQKFAEHLESLGFAATVEDGEQALSTFNWIEVAVTAREHGVLRLLPRSQELQPQPRSLRRGGTGISVLELDCERTVAATKRG